MELAGQPILLERLTPSQAKAIFVQHGAPETAFSSPEALKAAWKKLIIQHHPDRGGSPGVAQEVNAAFDVLKSTPVSSSGSSQDWPDYSKGSYGRSSQEDSDPYPVWAQAGWSGGARESGRISRNDYRDMNFFKKKMWELSGQSKEEWTITAFDGSFFRNSLTVYGSPKIFKDMAEAMVMWNSKGGNSYPTRAVFASRRRSKKMYVIYCDGKFMSFDPPALAHDSMNDNPSNDQSFMRQMPEMLDRIMAQRQQSRNSRAEAEDREWQGRTRNGDN
jgi:hypothetical protein